MFLEKFLLILLVLKFVYVSALVVSLKIKTSTMKFIEKLSHAIFTCLLGVLIIMHFSFFNEHKETFVISQEVGGYIWLYGVTTVIESVHLIYKDIKEEEEILAEEKRRRKRV
jgi:heme exporter protein D